MLLGRSLSHFPDVEDEAWRVELPVPGHPLAMASPGTQLFLTITPLLPLEPQFPLVDGGGAVLSLLLLCTSSQEDHSSQFVGNC